MTRTTDTAGINLDAELEKVHTYTEDGTVEPQEAARAITEALEAAGWVLDQGYSPEEQRQGDPGYDLVDLRFFMPQGPLIWVQLECPHDEAPSGEGVRS